MICVYTGYEMIAFAMFCIHGIRNAWIQNDFNGLWGVHHGLRTCNLAIWRSHQSGNLAQPAIWWPRNQGQSGDDDSLVQSGADANLANLAEQPIWQSGNWSNLAHTHKVDCNLDPTREKISNIWIKKKTGHQIGEKTSDRAVPDWCQIGLHKTSCQIGPPICQTGLRLPSILKAKQNGQKTILWDATLSYFLKHKAYYVFY